jgi:O-antigen/teichoic acid export membrane protein
MGKFKKLAGETAIYGLSSIIGRAINFVLVPFYTSKEILQVAEYGIVTELYSYVAVLNVLFLYGMETAYFRFTSKTGSSEEQIYSNVLTSILCTTLLLGAILLFSATPIINWLEFPGQEKFVYWLAAIISIDAIMAIPFVKLRYEGKARQFASYKLINIFLNLGLNLFFLYFCKKIWAGEMLPGYKGLIGHVYNPDYGVEYVFISNLIANSVYIVLLFDVLKKARIRINKTVLFPMVLYALPLLLSQLAGNFNEMFSRMMLKKILPEGFYPEFTNQEALGIFGACYKISMIMALAIQAFRFAAEPFFFRESQSADSKHTYARIFHYFGVFGLFSVLAISLNLDMIKVIVLRDDDYWTGIHIVPILLMATFFSWIVLQSVYLVQNYGQNPLRYPYLGFCSFSYHRSQYWPDTRAGLSRIGHYYLDCICLYVSICLSDRPETLPRQIRYGKTGHLWCSHACFVDFWLVHQPSKPHHSAVHQRGANCLICYNSMSV